MVCLSIFASAFISSVQAQGGGGPFAAGSSSFVVAVDTKYWLYVNGDMIVFEGGLKRGPRRGAGYYDTVDVSSAPWRAGANSVAILALFLGRRTVPPAQEWWNNEHADSGRHALLLAGNICGGDAALATSAAWRAVPHPGFSNDLESDAAQNFRFSEPDIVFDAAAAAPLANWTAPSFDDATWPRATALGDPGDAPWGALVARPIPQWRYAGAVHACAAPALRSEADADDGDGFRATHDADIPGQDLLGRLPDGCCASAGACKQACLAVPACRAAVWTGQSGACNLKTRTRTVSAPAPLKRSVYVRSFKRLVCALPHDTHVTPALRLRGATGAASAPHSLSLARGLRVDMRTDSYLTDAAGASKAAGFGIPNTRAAYVASGQEAPGRWYESPGWMVGHELRFSVDRRAPVDLAAALEVGYRESGYDAALTPAFECDVPALATLWRKAQRTLYVNARDSYMDCPDRERSQWPFDVAMDVHQAFYALAPAAAALSRKWIDEFVGWQKVDASAPAYAPTYAPMSLYGPVPGHWVKELPDQSLQSLAYGFSTYFDHTGDVATMRGALRAATSYLLSWRTAPAPRGEGELVVPRACPPPQPHGADVQCVGLWDWCDGESVGCDYAPIDNAWMWWALNSTARVARAVNGTAAQLQPGGGEAEAPITGAQLAELERRARALAVAFDREFWDESCGSCGCYRSAEHRARPAGGTANCTTKLDNCTRADDRPNALAVVTGLAPVDKHLRVARSVLDLAAGANASTFASPAMEKFVLEAMFIAGEEQHDAALRRMQARFGDMVRSNLTTLWEHWESDPATGRPIAGYNHGWSGGALVLLSQYVVGLAPARPAPGAAPGPEEKLERLRTLDCFVLDNSIRETTVGSIRGHIPADKHRILELVDTCGFKERVIAAFGDHRRADNKFVEELVESKADLSTSWCFSEQYDRMEAGLPVLDTPHGMAMAEQYAIPNLILERNIVCRQTNWSLWSEEEELQMFTRRLEAARRSGMRRVFINFRDFCTACAENMPRVLSTARHLAALARASPGLPLGIIWEEPTGKYFPFEIVDWVSSVRAAMDDAGWEDGHLLVHIHRGYGMAEATVIECLAAGCTGIWCATCVNGAATGHACSAITLTNLARVGNDKVRAAYSLPAVRRCAIEVSKIVTGAAPEPQSEVYGERALETVFDASAGMAGDDPGEINRKIFEVKGTRLRISTMSSPGMFKKKFEDTFGQPVQLAVCEKMRATVHEDLVSGRKEEYNTSTGLLELYERAGGEVTDKMVERSVNEAGFKHHRVVLELKAAWEATVRKGGDEAQTMPFRLFYDSFMGHFVPCYSCNLAKVIFDELDVTHDGQLDWLEIENRACWAIDEYADEIEHADDLLRIVFTKLMLPLAIERSMQRSGDGDAVTAGKEARRSLVHELRPSTSNRGHLDAPFSLTVVDSGRQLYRHTSRGVGRQISSKEDIREAQDTDA
eukprot:g3606.t1